MGSFHSLAGHRQISIHIPITSEMFLTAGHNEFATLLDRDMNWVCDRMTGGSPDNDIKSLCLPSSCVDLMVSFRLPAQKIFLLPHVF